MGILRSRLSKLSVIGIPLALRAIRVALLSQVHAVRLVLRDCILSSYSQSGEYGEIRRLLPPNPPTGLLPPGESSREYIATYLRHEFDLRGKGWEFVGFDESANRMGGSLLATSTRIQNEIRALIDPGYSRIDWHLANWRTSSSNSLRPSVFGQIKTEIGFDPKSAWELGRLHHLCTFALRYHSQDATIAERVQLEAEFKNQILDFIAQNPPRFGIHWTVGIEVSIRAVNMLLALDIFRSGGACFEKKFLEIFANSIADHRNFIQFNLERYGELRGNHHLTNLAALLMIECYKGKYSNNYVQSLSNQAALFSRELRVQFNRDGVFAEGSTGYHRYGIELICVAYAYFSLAMSELGADRFDSIAASPTLIDFDWWRKCIAKGIEFLDAIERKNGTMTLVGDNDSGSFLGIGRLVRTMPIARAIEKYDGLDAHQLSDPTKLFFLVLPADSKNILKIFEWIRPADAAGATTPTLPISNRLEKFFVPSVDVVITNGTQLPVSTIYGDAYHFDTVISRVLLRKKYSIRRNFALRAEMSALSVRSIRYWIETGILIFDSQIGSVVVRCGGATAVGWTLGGHLHNDQLSIDLPDSFEKPTNDPGTVTYTSNIELRNRYRSSAAHDCPRIEKREPTDLSRGIFFNHWRYDGECVFLSDSQFLGRHCEYGEPIYRLIELNERGIVVTDYANFEFVSTPEPIPIAPKYGYQSVPGNS